jgi:hypothetical protein
LSTHDTERDEAQAASVPRAARPSWRSSPGRGSSSIRPTGDRDRTASGLTEHVQRGRDVCRKAAPNRIDPARHLRRVRCYTLDDAKRIARASGYRREPHDRRLQQLDPGPAPDRTAGDHDHRRDAGRGRGDTRQRRREPGSGRGPERNPVRAVGRSHLSRCFVREQQRLCVGRPVSAEALRRGVRRPASGRLRQERPGGGDLRLLRPSMHVPA